MQLVLVAVDRDAPRHSRGDTLEYPQRHHWRNLVGLNHPQFLAVRAEEHVEGWPAVKRDRANAARVDRISTTVPQRMHRDTIDGEGAIGRHQHAVAMEFKDFDNRFRLPDAADDVVAGGREHVRATQRSQRALVVVVVRPCSARKTKERDRDNETESNVCLHTVILPRDACSWPTHAQSAVETAHRGRRTGNRTTLLAVPSEQTLGPGRTRRGCRRTGAER